MKTRKLVIPGRTVTPADVENAIVKEEAVKLGSKITVVHLTLADGFEVIGKSGVVDPTNFDLEIGAKYARENALNRVWEHMGSVLQDRLLEE